MRAIGVDIGDEGVGAFDPAGHVVGHKQIENAIDAVGGNAAAAGRGDRIGHIIGRNRAIISCKCGKHGCAQRRPLLAGAFQPGLGGGGKIGSAVMLSVAVGGMCHDLHIGLCGPPCKTVGGSGDAERLHVLPVRKRQDSHAGHRDEHFGNGAMFHRQ